MCLINFSFVSLRIFKKFVFYVSGTFPLDLTKTRLQVQGQQFEANFKSVKYRGMLHAMRVIASEEGFGALYFG